MKLGMQIRFDHGHIALPQRGTALPQFSAHICCGQMAGCIKVPLGTEVGLSPGDFLLDGDPAPPSPQIFGPCLLWPNGWMHPDATWYGGRSQPRGLCVRWGPSPPLPKRGRNFPIFGPCLLPPNECMDQDATWHGGRPQPRRLCVRWGRSTPQKGAQPPNFRPMSIVAKRLDGSRWHLAWR